MKKYYYKDGTEVKAGDITFYSEYDGVNDSFRYADSIQVIVEKEDGLHYLHCISTIDESNSFQICEQQDGDTVHIKYGTEYVFDGSNNIFGKGKTLQLSTKIGHISTDSHLITPEYAKILSDKNYNDKRTL